MAVKYRNVLVLLGIIAVLVVVAILSTNKASSKEMISDDHLRRILVERPRDTTEILIGDQGVLVNPGEYPGDTVVVNLLIAQLKNAQLDEVISEHPETHTDFGVDDNGYKVTLDGKRSRSFYIGKQSSDHVHAYIRFAGEDKVYLARGISRAMFDRDQVEWRDKNILLLDMDEITKLLVDDQEYIKQGSQWFLRGQEMDPMKMTEVLNLLSNLRAFGFIEGAVFEPVTRITIVTDAATYGIEIGNKHDEFFYLLRLRGHKAVYLVNEYVVDQVRGLSPKSM
ncbi:MAG: DUF4340 domain-containing protein [candidate division WOR-3 bacterium]|nr:MAG: DUF4340 domain-containing protein [candidate division WOR-3 bacterium]